MNRNRYQKDSHKLSQTNRKLPELSIDYIHPIESDNEDLINYSFKYAQFLNYYNNENKIDGNWQEFYGSNFSIILSILEQVDFYAHREKFKLLHENIQFSNDIDVSKSTLNNLFDFLFHFLNDIDQIYKLLHSIDIFTFEDKLDPVLIEEIVFYKEQLGRWKEESKGIASSSASSSINYENVENQEEDFYIFKNGNNAIGKIKNGLEKLNAFFIEFAAKSRHQILIKKKGLKNKISLQSTNQSYTPNLALIKAFVDVFLLLKENNKTITKRHLDFYYKQILAQTTKEASKDYAHLVIIPGINSESLEIKKDNLFVANIETLSPNPIVYKSIANVLIGQSKIKKVINLCLSSTSNNRLIEKSVFTKSIDIENPVEGIGNKQMALFGNNQTFITDDSLLKMDVGTIGFYLGSKILYQQSGDRLFNVTLYFEKNAFSELRGFIKTYSNTNQRDTRTLSNDLFKAAFDIYYSNKDGWNLFENFTVSFDPDDVAEHKIEYNFKLTSDDPSFDVYNNPIHGDLEDITTPLFKFVVNPNSFFNAYNFFFGLFIERVGFQIFVKNDLNLSLRNNNGGVSAENPFQMFGATPNLQSFLDIQNENIFNKYTKDFTININWFDLPLNENGFKEYYNEYESEIDNDSFQVGISALEKGKFRPSFAQQQTFQLFSSYRIDDKVGYISPKTTISSIDFSKIKFSNDMNYDRIENDIIDRHSEGMARLSLLNPVIAFGHKLFTKLFTEISLHNSKWYKRKKKLPNEPISPNIKSISVDYTLETNELLNNSIQRNKNQSDITIIQIHPFGYEKIYPNSVKAFQALLPRYHADNHFIIGIDTVYPEQEISIYFELEELKTEYSVQENYSTQWFYLSNNSWKPFSSKHILEDTSKNLIQSGIIKLVIPKGITNTNTIISDPLFYIKVELTNNISLKKKLKNVYLNGILVERVFGETYNNDFVKLPENAIDKLLVDIPEIDEVIQPYTNFKGLPPEPEEKFYIRVSEMLRTKNRFVTTRDISQAILNKFESIALVDCLGNGMQNAILQKSIAGKNDLVITLIPKFSKIENYDIDNIPLVESELLFQVKEFVKTLVPDEVNVILLNPIYEKIKINCSVVFKDIRGNNELKIYSNLLNTDISNFIAPWIENGSEQGIQIKNVLNINEIENFIKNRPYINMVNSLSIIHLFPIYNEVTKKITYKLNDTALTPFKKIHASLINSVFAPVNNHQIVASMELLSKSPSKVGINELEIGKELIIQDNTLAYNYSNEIKDNKQKSNNFTITLKI
jgi:hypothetical protein